VPVEGPEFAGHVLTASFKDPGCRDGVFFKLRCASGDIQIRFASPSSAPRSELPYEGGPADCIRDVWAIGLKTTAGPDMIDVERVRTAYIGPYSVIRSFDGDDVINGTGGDETIVSGPRSDGSGDDDRVRANGGKDRVISGRGQDRVKGGRYHDILRGGSADDRLYGEFQRDRLAGGAGQDLLVGGPGRDSFPNSGNDEVHP
jgi:hypothetical protein